jgi:hypothetical protein
VLLRQPDPAHKVLEAAVGAHWVEPRIGSQPGHAAKVEVPVEIVEIEDEGSLIAVTIGVQCDGFANDESPPDIPMASQSQAGCFNL